MFSMLGKKSPDDILKYFSYFFQKIRFGFSLQSKSVIWENKKNIISLSSAYFTNSVLNVKLNKSTLSESKSDLVTVTRQLTFILQYL